MASGSGAGDLSPTSNDHDRGDQNGDHNDGSLPFRRAPNAAFADIQFYGPPASAQARTILDFPMTIRATSTVRFSNLVSDSYAVAHLWRQGGTRPIARSSVAATPELIEPDAVDIGAVEGTVTLQYEWKELTINQPGTYFYEVVIFARPVDNGEATSLGVHYSEYVAVSW